MRLFIALAGIVAVISCTGPTPPPESEPKVTLIGISKLYPDSVIQKWLLQFDSRISFVELYGLKSPELDSVIVKCNGLLLSGGADISTSLYHQKANDSLCGESDLYRDSMELLAYDYAFRMKIPVIGICRGLQLMNIASGGTLIADIPSIKGSLLHQTDSLDAFHKITLTEGSILALRCSFIEGEVNSNHHQCIDSVGEGYDIIAFAADSVVEAIHYTNQNNHPFLLGVQWHPERMPYSAPLSREPAKLFLKAVKENF